MAKNFDINFVALRCHHPDCQEVFECSLGDIAGVDKIFCPRCGTPAHISEEIHQLAAAKLPENWANSDKATR